MNQYSFINELRGCLSFMSPDERDAAVRYYEEYFAEAGPERAGEILSELGSASKVAGDIKRDYFSSKEPTGRDLAAPGDLKESGTAQAYGGAGAPPPNPGGWGASYAPPPPPPPPPPPQWQAQQGAWQGKKGFPTWLIVVLIVFAIPVGIPLVSVVFSLIVAAFAVIFSLFAAFFGSGLGLIGGGIYVFVSGFWALGFMPDALMLFGTGLIFIAVGLPLLWLGVWIFARLFKLLCRGVSSLFSKIFGKKGQTAV